MPDQLPKTCTSSPNPLPKGVEFISGNVYRVELSAIKFADGGFNKESTDLNFTNLRHALADQHLTGQGMSKDEMNELRERIRTEGLLHTPMLRWYDGGVQIIMGERRLRCIHKLVHDNASCFDRSKGEYVPAKELYKTIIVEILELDDRQAYKLSFSETESVSHFGNAAKVAAVAYFRSCGESDKNIISMTGLGPEWLSLADKVAPDRLGKTCFAAFAQTEDSDVFMSLDTAVKLAEYTDEAERETVFEEWKKNCIVRTHKKGKKLGAEVETATQKVAEADAEMEDALHEAEDLADSLEGEKEVLFVDDSASAIQVNAKLAEQQQKQEKAAKRKVVAETKLKGHAAKKPKIVSKDTGGGEKSEPKPLTHQQLKKLWYGPVIEFIDADGCDSEGKKVSEVDLQDARLVKSLIEQLLKGQTHIFKILVGHYRKKRG